jgi:hypothetical protein
MEKMEHVKNIDKITELIAESITMNEVDDVLHILTSLLLTSAVMGGIDQEDLEEFLMEATEATYSSTHVIRQEYLQ